MECKEFEKQIPQFLKQKLDFFGIQRFCVHMDKCPKCKEELVIQFLITEGMARLEDGDAFDLQNELEQRLNEEKRKVKFHFGCLHIGELLQVLTTTLLIIVIGWLLS